MPELRTDESTPVADVEETTIIATDDAVVDIKAIIAELDVEASAAVSAGAEPPVAVHDPEVVETTEEDAALAAAADTIEPPVVVHDPAVEAVEDVHVTGDEDPEDALPIEEDGAEVPSIAPASFRRRMRGYDRQQVNHAIAGHEQRTATLEAELRLRDARIEELDESLRRTRMELRYWHDRQAFIDAEIDRARQTATDMEQSARERAERLEQDAQQRAITMIDRVCTEANGILAHAREEAQALVARYDDDVTLGEQRIRQLSSIQQDIVHAMRAAMGRFEDGIQELHLVTPSAQAVKHPSPQRERGAAPTFGRERATAAAAGGRMPEPQPSGQGVIDTRGKVQLGGAPDKHIDAETVDAMLLLGGPF
jgi:cell division septum initiation protein DivIVA